MLPFLDIMGERTLAAESGAKESRRLACFCIPGAMGRHGWFPNDTPPRDTLARSHQPLAKLRDEFSVLTNLSQVAGRIGGHVHPYNWLTGHNINPTPGTITNIV